MTVADDQPLFLGRHADDSKGAALALAKRLKFGQAAWRNRQHVTLLRLVAPDFGRRHAGFFGWHFT